MARIKYGHLPKELEKKWDLIMLQRCKVYDPQKGHHWAIYNIGEEWMRKAWSIEFYLTHLSYTNFYLRQPIEEQVEKLYLDYMETFSRRVSDDDFRKYMELSPRSYSDRDILLILSGEDDF